MRARLDRPRALLPQAGSNAQETPKFDRTKGGIRQNPHLFRQQILPEGPIQNKNSSLRLASKPKQNEIPKTGFSATEIEMRIADKKPGSVILILDACRSLISSEPNTATNAGDPKGPLFRTIGRGTGKFTRTVLPQANAYAMIGRRAAAAGIATKLGNHSFRATGNITLP